MRLIYHPEAQREVEEAASFYEERATGLGGEFLDAVEAAGIVSSRIPRSAILFVPGYGGTS